MRVFYCVCALGVWMVCTFLGAVLGSRHNCSHVWMSWLARNCVAATHDCTLLSFRYADHAVAHIVSCLLAILIKQLHTL